MSGHRTSRPSLLLLRIDMVSIYFYFLASTLRMDGFKLARILWTSRPLVEGIVTNSMEDTQI